MDPAAREFNMAGNICKSGITRDAGKRDGVRRAGLLAIERLAPSCGSQPERADRAVTNIQ